MENAVPADRSNGYEAVAAEFMRLRATSKIGASTVRNWARALPPGAAVLDLGCGDGVPISAELAEAGATLYGVDASPSMLAVFRGRFPDAHLDCSAVQDADFFGRRFDAVIAWGLMFLLTPGDQVRLISKIAGALESAGALLFTAPRQPCEWPDHLTGKRSVSLGAAAYRRLVETAGLKMVGELEDEGRNHYYLARKPPPG